MSIIGGGSSEYTEKENRNITLAELGGGGIGAGAGLLASFPMDAMYQKKLVERSKQLNMDKEIAKRNWETLLQLYKGTLSLKDLPESQRDFFARQLEENADDLKHLSRNPLEAKKSLQEITHGIVEPFTGADKPKMKGRFPYKVRSPLSPALPGAIGLAGMIGAGAGLRKLYDKDKVDPLDELRGQLKQIQDDLKNQ